MLNTHVRPYFGHIRSDRFREEHAIEWVEKKANDISADKFSPKTYNNVLILLHSILAWARMPAQRYMTRNPFAEQPLLPKTMAERRFLDRAAIAALIAAADCILDRTLITVAIYSGLRRGELFGLFWEDIDWSAGRISVRRSILGENLSSPKTRTSVRRVDVPRSVLACLEAYRKRFPPRVSDLGAFIFRKDNGRPLCVDNWAHRVLPRLCRKAGIHRVTLHCLRHTYASLLINNGENVKYVSRQMGHAGIQITVDTYGHLFEETSVAAMDRLENGMEAPSDGTSKAMQRLEMPIEGEPDVRAMQGTLLLPLDRGPIETHVPSSPDGDIPRNTKG